MASEAIARQAVVIGAGKTGAQPFQGRGHAAQGAMDVGRPAHHRAQADQCVAPLRPFQDAKAAQRRHREQDDQEIWGHRHFRISS